jgi:hypothetical protein
MKQTFLGALATLVIASIAVAQQRQQNGSDFSPLSKPVSPLSKPLSAIKGDPRVYDTIPPPRNNVWDTIQNSLDRSTGRIEDQQSYELWRIEQMRRDRDYREFRVRDYDRFREERERALRLEERERRADQDDERARRRELDRRESLLYVTSPYSPLAEQVERDLKALEQARWLRDQTLYEASLRLDAALKQPGANRAELQQQYEQTRQQARERYESDRTRILGYVPDRD